MAKKKEVKVEEVKDNKCPHCGQSLNASYVVKDGKNYCSPLCANS